MKINLETDEFVEARSWQEFELGDLVDLVNGRAFKPSDWSQNGLPIIRIQNLNGGDEYNYYEGEHDSKYVVDQDELLFSWSGSRGTSFGPFIWNGGKAILNQHIFKVIIKNERLFDKSFGFYVLKNVTTEIEKQAHGSAGLVHVTKKTLEKIKFRVPDLPEQQQIAEILSTVDEKIDVIDAQITQTQELKKGLMQRLLTKGIGHTQFKDSPLGEIPESWEVVELNTVFKTVVVGFVGSISSHYCDSDTGVQFIRTLNVKDGYFDLNGIEFVTVDFHRKNKKSQISNEDILIARVGANMGLVCRVNGLEGEANAANVIIIKGEKEVNSEFYSNFLSSNAGQMQIHSQGIGGAQEVFNTSLAKTLKIPFVPIQEQNKIAGILTQVNAKIEILEIKKSKYLNLKKALMQQLLTGRLRVNHLIKNSIPA
jgi:type I restriction enzyme, S subunit